MSLEINSFEFDDFVLDGREKVLFRNDKPVSITPKAFQLLQVLVENHGHLVEKSDLMKAVWQDSFVEDGNLTFTIRLLRKALGDSSQNSRFIETVPRRGYRFIADVKKNPLESEAETETLIRKTDSLAFKNKLSGKPRYVLIVASIIILIGSLFASRYLQRSSKATAITLLNTPFTSEKLSTDGKVMQAVISSDGKNVVYVRSYRSDKNSIWLKQIESGNNVEIIPPADVIYAGLALSPDGNFLYFSRRQKGFDGQTDVFRVSIFGGVPTKTVGETQGWISISPDGGKISFVRCFYLKNEYCSLWIADSIDGKNEKKLVSRPQPFRIGDNEFSPDGRTVAFAVGQSRNQSNEFNLMEVDIESGKEKLLTDEKFFNIKAIAWLPAQNGLLITALKVPNANYRIWRVSAESGSVEPMTKDSENYSVLSIDKNETRLVSTQVKDDFHLRLLNLENPFEKEVLIKAVGASFATDGKILFSSVMSGNNEIWSINTDGSGQKQLTTNSVNSSKPIFSASRDAIFFSSNRSGRTQIWRIDSDGGNQTQITRREGGFPVFVTPDGKWVYFQHGLDRTLWRVFVENGREEKVLDKPLNRISFSPDGSKTAVLETLDKKISIVISSIETKEVIKTIKFPNTNLKITDIAWMPDGENLVYILADNEYVNPTLWIESIKRNSAKPQKIADLGDEEISEMSGLAVSPDGKFLSIIQGGWKHDAVLLTGLK